MHWPKKMNIHIFPICTHSVTKVISKFESTIIRLFIYIIDIDKHKKQESSFLYRKMILKHFNAY